MNIKNTEDIIIPMVPSTGSCAALNSTKQNLQHTVCEKEFIL